MLSVIRGLNFQIGGRSSVKMSSRRRSVLPVSKSVAPTISTTTSRRASLATMRPPAAPKPVAKAPVQAKTKKPTAASKKFEFRDDLVSGDQFDFQLSESPVGPVTRYFVISYTFLKCHFPANPDGRINTKLNSRIFDQTAK